MGDCCADGVVETQGLKSFTFKMKNVEMWLDSPIHTWEWLRDERKNESITDDLYWILFIMPLYYR